MVTHLRVQVLSAFGERAGAQPQHDVDVRLFLLGVVLWVVVGGQRRGDETAKHVRDFRRLSAGAS